MAPLKLIAFDWDQTLWHSWDVHVSAARYAADQLDLPEPSEDLIASIFSVPFAQHLKILFAQATDQATEWYMEYYHSMGKELANLFAGVPEMLESLKADGYLVALLSDKRNVHGDKELESTTVAALFDYVLFRNGDRAYKPDPQGLRTIMEALSVKKEQTLYVGDSHVDIQCARNSGVTSAAALWGSVNVDAVLSERPDYTLHGVEDVLTALHALPDQL